MGFNFEGVKIFVEDFMFAGGDKRNGKMIFMFGAICWMLWLNRNDLVFNNTIISSPKALIFKFLSFLQHWMIAWTGADREWLKQLVESMTVKASEDRVEEGGG
jgi:hypothetical protein